MKYLILLLTALGILSFGAAATPHHKLGHLRSVLQQVNVDVNQRLVDVYPELKPKLAKYGSQIEYCYDPTVGNGNGQVNIFKEKIGTVVERYFVSE